MQREPVITAVSVASVIVALASIFNVVLDLSTVETIAVVVVPFLSQLFARNEVTPV